MKKNKEPVLYKLPEYYLIIFILLAGYTPPFSFNPVAIVLAFLILLQIIFRNPESGIIIAVLFIMANVYMLFAMISEFNEFPTFELGAKQLLLTGIPLFILNVAMSVLMISGCVQSPVKSKVITK